MNLSRRSLFAGAAALPALSHVLQGAQAGAAEDLKLGVATYSLRSFNFLDTVKAMQELKIRYAKLKLEVHLPYTSSPDQVREAKKVLDDAGIILIGSGNTNLAKNDPGDIRQKFEFNKALGVQVMTCAPTAETLPIVEQMVKEYDIKVAIHNHGPEDKHFPAPSDALKLIKNMDPRVGVCMDAGHTSRTGVDIVKATRECGARLYDVDVKDLADAMVSKSQCDVGDGVLPIAPLLKMLKQEMKYQYVVMLEYEINAKNPLPGMHRSFSYMRGVLAGLRA
jgi:sugar phosphate isomerase/epimerase